MGLIVPRTSTVRPRSPPVRTSSVPASVENRSGRLVSVPAASCSAAGASSTDATDVPARVVPPGRLMAISTPATARTAVEPTSPSIQPQRLPPPPSTVMVSCQSARDLPVPPALDALLEADCSVSGVSVEGVSPASSLAWVSVVTSRTRPRYRVDQPQPNHRPRATRWGRGKRCCPATRTWRARGEPSSGAGQHSECRTCLRFRHQLCRLVVCLTDWHRSGHRRLGDAVSHE